MVDGTNNAVVISFQRGEGHLWWHPSQPAMSAGDAVRIAKNLSKDPMSLGEVYFVAEAGKAPPYHPMRSLAHSVENDSGKPYRLLTLPAAIDIIGIAMSD